MKYRGFHFLVFFLASLIPHQVHLALPFDPEDNILCIDNEVETGVTLVLAQIAEGEALFSLFVHNLHKTGKA